MKREQIRALYVYIGKKITERRKKVGMTLLDVAREIGTSMQQIQKYECAHSPIRADRLYQIAYALGISIDYFFKGFTDFTAHSPLHAQTSIRADQSCPLHILLIEDNDADIYLTRKACALSSVPIEMLVMHESVDIFRFLRHQTMRIDFPRPDLILLDLRLPKVDGHALLRELKRDVTLSDIPVVVMTNSLRQQDMQTCYQEHASGYLCKSFDFDVFAYDMDTLARYWAHTVVLPLRQQKKQADEGGEYGTRTSCFSACA